MTYFCQSDFILVARHYHIISFFASLFKRYLNTNVMILESLKSIGQFRHAYMNEKSFQLRTTLRKSLLDHGQKHLLGTRLIIRVAAIF